MNTLSAVGLAIMFVCLYALIVALIQSLTKHKISEWLLNFLVILGVIMITWALVYIIAVANGVVSSII